MSVLSQVKIEQHRGWGFDLGDAWQGVVDVVREQFADDIWRWFHAHAEDKVITINKWFLSYTVRVKHLRELFEVLAGEDPTT